MSASSAVPDWVKWDADRDCLVLHGRLYSSILFGLEGFLAPPGTVLRIVQNDADTITCETVRDRASKSCKWIHDPDDLRRSTCGEEMVCHVDPREYTLYCHHCGGKVEFPFARPESES